MRSCSFWLRLYRELQFLLSMITGYSPLLHDTHTHTHTHTHTLTHSLTDKQATCTRAGNHTVPTLRPSRAIMGNASSHCPHNVKRS